MIVVVLNQIFFAGPGYCILFHLDNLNQSNGLFCDVLSTAAFSFKPENIIIIHYQ